jgi:type I restriction enzyme, S subunit
MSKWNLFTLRDICQATQGVQIPKNKQLNTKKKGYRRYFYISDFTHDKKLKYVEDKYPKKNFTPTDLIVSNTGSHGEIFRGKEGILSNNLFKVTIDEKVVNDYFLVYFLKSNLFKKFQSKRVRGTANPHMGHKNFLDTPINLPPLSEQRQIVAKLDAAFDNIDAIIKKNKNNLEQTKILFQNIIDSNLNSPNFPCEKIELKKLITIKHGFAFKGQDFSRSSSTSLPIVLTPGNFSENADLYFTDKNTKRIRTKVNKELFFSKGNLVIVMTDLSAKMDLLGNPAFINNENILHNQRIGLVKNDELKVLNDYLYFYFMSKSYLTNIKKTASGTMVRHTAPKRILDNKINIPILLTHQKEIVEKISFARIQIENFKLLKDKKIKLLENLRNNIFIKEMQKEINVA